MPPAKTFTVLERWAFLTHQVEWNCIDPQAIACFVAAELRRHPNRFTQKSICTAIRSLLRYVRLTHPLLGGAALLLPRLPHWRQAQIPQHLSEEQMALLHAACAGQQPAFVRLRCLLVLFTRLGLRTAEAAALSLDDIDWAQGRLLIRGGKNRRDRSLPLPEEVGQALVEYLQQPRPACAPRFVFLAANSPYGSSQNYDRVRSEIRRLLRKAGISGVRLGAHALRHTAASAMVNRGASLKQVADVLGHHSLETTAIYAKLNLAALAEVALPWPGEAQ